MPPHVALVTCTEHADLTADDRLYETALRETGVRPVPAVWDDLDVDWDAFDALVVRSTWDYYRNAEAFHAWLDAREAGDCPLHNPAAVCRWNAHKFYLRDLADRGVPTLPTRYVERGTDEPLAAVLAEAGWAEAVVKPAVAAGAFETWRTTPEADDEARFRALVAERDVLVQQYAPEIVDGEVSVLFFGGQFSHAARKRPADGDFRVQEEYGGRTDPATVSPEVVEQAAAVLDAAGAETGVAPEELLYARVDGVQRDGTFHLVELELIEPSLYLETDPASADRLAEATLTALRGR